MQKEINEITEIKDIYYIGREMDGIIEIDFGAAWEDIEQIRAVLEDKEHIVKIKTYDIMESEPIWN